MKHTISQIRNKWLSILAFIVFFSAAPILIEYYYLQYSSPEAWFEYTVITVEPPIIEENTKHINVLSFAVIKRPVKMLWTDRLFCSKKSGDEFVSSFDSSAEFTKPTILPRVYTNLETGVDELIPWRYPVNTTLDAGDVCHLESTITAELKYAITKKAQVRSNDFVVQ